MVFRFRKEDNGQQIRCEVLGDGGTISVDKTVSVGCESISDQTE